MSTIRELGSFDINYETGEGYWSPEFISIIGLPKNHSGDFQEFLLRIHPHDRPLVSDARNRAFRRHSSRTNDLELRVSEKNGAVRWVQFMVGAFGQERVFGETECIVGLVTEVSGRRALNPWKAHFLSSWERTASRPRFGSFHMNFRTGEEYWSPDLAAIFGLQEGKAGGFEVLFKHVHPDDRLDLVSACIPALRPDWPRISMRHRIVREDGEVRLVQMAGCAMFGARSTRVASFAGIVADITGEHDDRMD